MKGEKEEKERKEKITHQIQFHGLVLRTEFTKQSLRGVAVGAVGFGENDLFTIQTFISALTLNTTSQTLAK